ncbi:hypothetical protein SAMN04488502_1011114 [Dendrosporobacter quercicolus]|uniref:Uncharacterized protein n=1 Tax=Dendrosporobacter quercicolus TaxID=146817 RepID=A0A1G9NSS7_9FIRM|nr:hypothetical protein [Dendrosporobacter quercicolus]SDL89440.1 hypothetical protein SAMN04488502_1011114 [Dendrosporobacter quercicolus]
MSDYTPRRKRLALSAFTTSEMHVRNPLMAVWWAASFGGFGQIMIGSYIKGFVLVAMEVLINLMTNLNVAILYSFTGRIELAKEVLDTRWLMAYALAYCYGLWDAYNHSVSLNKQAVLAEREKAPIDVFTVLPYSINFLDKRSPWVSVFWSVVFPGLGHMFVMRMVTGLFLITFWMVSAYYSRLFQVVHFTFLGDLGQALAVADPQWLLFMPSIYCFAAYDSYSCTVELNKKFDAEQREYLAKRYQRLLLELPMPITEGATQMLIAATFNHSSFVELAITELEAKGIAKEKMLAIPLAQKQKNFAILDTIYRSDGVSIIDTASVFGTIGMVLGTIYGFVWSWGPIIWALIGLFGGAAVGLAGDYLLTGRKMTRQRRDKVSELVLLVSCVNGEANMVEQVLRNNTAFGVGTVKA